MVCEKAIIFLCPLVEAHWQHKETTGIFWNRLCGKPGIFFPTRNSCRKPEILQKPSTDFGLHSKAIYLSSCLPQTLRCNPKVERETMSLRYTSRMCLRAIQLLKEQQMGSKPMATLKSSSPSQSQARANRVRWFSSAATDHSTKEPGLDEKLKRRRAEKAENVMHLVCWGPN